MSPRYLLDTLMLIWWLADQAAIPATGREILSDPDTIVYASSISIWEITIKSAVGKIEADVDRVCASLAPAGLLALSFDVPDAAAVAALPALHRDPFDRALIAQARCKGLRLITVDAKLGEYGGDILCL